MKTTAREWALAVGGGLLLAGGLVWALRGGEEAVEVTAPVAVAPVLIAPALPVAAAPAAAVAPVAAAAGDGGLTLRGVLLRPGGATAIIETGDGRQRLVREGGEIAPGVRLERVAAKSVVVARGEARETLGFGEAAVPLAVAESGAESGGAGLAGRARDYTLGMRPRRSGSAVTGYAITDIADLPVFRRAGLRVGDVVVSVNGTGLASSEKLMELPAEIAGANDVEIVFERGGKLQTARVPAER